MPLDIILLIVRIAVALILYAFLGAVLVYVLRDIKTTSQHIDESQRVSGRLIVIEYKDTAIETGQTYPLRRLTTLGRGPTNTVVLQDSFASVQHAHIVYRSGQWWIEDQHSHNGTSLNDIPLTEAVVLSSGDIISIGQTKLLVELD
jgi:pSer/pThr/pTyr-binding forkhead associated (FHA) protein